MGKLFDKIYSGIEGLLRFLFLHFTKIARELWAAKGKIELRYLASDFLSVISSVGMIAFFNFIALLVFTLLPQGKDVLLIIVEDTIKFRAGNLVCLIIGIILWSIVSEFGSRYSIYVTDNTGKSLSDERVKWRKAVQRVIADIFLIMPFLIVFIGFLVNYVQDNSLDKGDKNFGFGIPVLLLFIVLNVLARLYFADRNQKRGLPDEEWQWCNKLYGIYNDHVFQIRQSSNFKNKIKGPYEIFTDNFTSLSREDKSLFPKRADLITQGSIVPQTFRFKTFTQTTEDSRAINSDCRYKWIYEIPIDFYKTLHKQLKIIVTISVVLFLIICFLPISFYTYVGAPGLIVTAFACWSGIQLWLIYMDYAVLRHYKVSLRFILFFLLIFSSFINNDHPVRFNNYTPQINSNKNYFTSDRPGLKDHFRQWFANYRADSNTQYYLKNDTTSFYPVVFVCAEGGALRTGAFAAETLSFLQDSLANSLNRINFKKTIYAFSGVSGGSVGISYFNAVEYLNKPEDLQEGTHSQLTEKFFNQDFLSPVIGKMFYGDIVNLFLPFHIELFDRAIALEKAWEQGYESIIKKEARNIFSSDFIDLTKTNTVSPAVFINTTEVESGFQCWLTNVKPDDSMFFADRRDLFGYKINGRINYSTMTNFSTRFPLFSPGAALIENDSKKYHYADGGYVENTGAATMLEIIKVLKPQLDSYRIKPFVLLLRYSNDSTGSTANINFANEFSEILFGIYNTRSGRGRIAVEELKRYIHSNFPLPANVIEFSLSKSGSEVPMNWVLSKKSLNLIKEDIKEKWKRKAEKPLKDFFAFDTANCLMCKNRVIIKLPAIIPK